jgi:hypothetical protein
MSPTASPSTENVVGQRLEVLFQELSELAGQRNAIDGRIVEIAAEMERRAVRLDGCAVIGSVDRLEAGLVIQKCPHHYRRRQPAGGFPPALRAYGRAGCRWIRLE